MKRGLVTAAVILIAGSASLVSSAHGATVDLTAAGSSATINGAIFKQQASSEDFNSFLRLQAHGNASLEQGFNTDGRPLVFDEDNSAQATRSLSVNQLQANMIGDMSYYTFFFNASEPNGGQKPTLDLLSLKIFLGNSANLLDVNNLGTLAYDLDGAADTTVHMKDVSNGNSSDYVINVPVANFTGPNQWVYLYSKLDTLDGHGGPEEWGALLGQRQIPPGGDEGGGNIPVGTAVPLPPAAWSGILMLALGAIGSGRKKFAAVFA